jgi:ribosomal protein S18 acetylase RimI-like enzyme
MTSSPFRIRPLGDHEDDCAWVARFVTTQWGADVVVAHDTVYYPASLPGFVAWQDGERVGLVTYHLEGDACEIVTMDSLRPGVGVGTALIETVRRAAQEAGCRRLWLVTTNDNLEALRFYQKRGFVLVAVHRDALERSRQLKPEIPLIGSHGIPLRDEIELEMSLE